MQAANGHEFRQVCLAAVLSAGSRVQPYTPAAGLICYWSLLFVAPLVPAVCTTLKGYRVRPARAWVECLNALDAANLCGAAAPAGV